jgi:hypothetical protein
MKWIFPPRSVTAAAMILSFTATMVAGETAASEGAWVRSRRSGNWFTPSTWEGGAVPTAGSRVRIRPGHQVVYDGVTERPIRFIHVGGTLTFSPDRNTRLDAGLIKIQPGENADEDGFNCDVHLPDAPVDGPQPELLVGTAERPIPPGRTAVIRLAYFEGMDKEACPAIICCAGRMEFHGAEMNRTWFKLGAPAKPGDSEVILGGEVIGWRPGDHVFLTATTRQNKLQKTFRPSVRDNTQTEERQIRAIDGTRVTLDRPLEFNHRVEGEYRGEIANLSRNVIVESADPAGIRGHTMYHRGSTGQIRYAEFRHLGKEGILGKYSIHFHMVRDTMRGSAVIGASIWDSGNRWITIHGSNYLVVRDCVGYRSIGHGFFLEDGTEVYNVLDRNLAVQAMGGKPLPKQVLPFDHNEGAGFWWANSKNTFTRNVAAECDEYGYRFDATPHGEGSLTFAVQQPDGSQKREDVRTLPFVRFEDNESHCQRRHAFNLGGIASELRGGVEGVGPDSHHPFLIKNMRIWNVHWAFHPLSPSVMVDGMDIYNAEYAFWRAAYERHAYRGVRTNTIAISLDFTPKGKHPAEKDFPGALAPEDDLPPMTVITDFQKTKAGGLVVRGITADDGAVRRVIVNGEQARPLAPNFAEWEATLSRKNATPVITAHAEDVAGNIEKRAHTVRLAR